MNELVVILSDLFSPLLRPGERSLPRLPALEMLLARGRCERLADDWRSWLARRFGAPPFAPAALVARAWSAPRGALAYWLATPVHLFAGIDRVVLHPAGLLRLSAAEQQALVEQFAADFADSPWRLRAGGQRELLLAGPALSASGADPARFLGVDPSAGLPRGPDAAALRRLGSELELWLHEHPLNRARARRGELPITTLWLWGGAAGATGAAGGSDAGRGTGGAAGSPAVPENSASRELGTAPRLYGSDTCAEALVRFLGGACEPLEAATPPGIAATIGAGPADRIVVYALQAGGAPGADGTPGARGEDGAQGEDNAYGADAAAWLGRLELLERQWLAPVLAALRAGRVHAVLLVAADHVYHLGRFGPWRIWRARAPWWEVLG